MGPECGLELKPEPKCHTLPLVPCWLAQARRLWRPHPWQPASLLHSIEGWPLLLSFVSPDQSGVPRTDVGPHSCPPGQRASQASCTSSWHWLPTLEKVGEGGRGCRVRFSCVSPPAFLPGVLGGLTVCPPAADHTLDSWAEPDTRCTVS